MYLDQHFPNRSTREHHLVRWDAGKTVVPCQIRLMEHSCDYRLGQKKLVSGSDPLRATCQEIRSWGRPREKQTFCQKQVGMCARRSKLWTSEYNLHISLLSSPTYLPFSFAASFPTLCFTQTTYSLLTSNGDSGPLLTSLTMWPWNCLFTNGALTIVLQLRPPYPLLKARGSVVFIALSPMPDTGPGSDWELN